MKKLFLASIAMVALSAGGSALAADMPVKAPIYKAPPPVQVFSWTGFYVGANVGYSWGRSSNDGTSLLQVHPNPKLLLFVHPMELHFV
jgi:outer membrane immunogenic protein